jgi:tetratricopeptide (TPR) repeat protein
MIRSGMSAVAALGLALGMMTAAGSARAQDVPAAPACSVDDGTPNEVAMAYLNLSRASGATAKDVQMKNLRDAVAQAEKNIERGQNLPGRAYIMAKAYVLMLSDTLIPLQATRGAVGLTSNPAAPVDMIVAIDSLLDVVESAHPDCAAEIEGWRQNNVWLDILNKAIVALDAQQLDSAEHYTRLTQRLHENNPYGYQLLATIANRRGQTDVEREMWTKTIEKAGTDTAMADVRDQAYFYLGNLYATQAEAAADPAEKVRLAKEAVRVYQEYLKSVKPEADASVIRTNLSLVMVMAGDSASIPTIYAAMLADPASYGVADLVAAGAMASRLNRGPDAAKLYEAVLTKSPYHREALFMATASYAVESQWDKVIPLAHRLIAVDPGNPENFRLLAHGYNGIVSAEAPTSPRRKVYLDSLVAITNKADSMPHVVTFTGLNTTPTKVTVQGTVENKTKAAKSLTLSFQFLDAQGNAVGSTDVTVQMAAEQTSPFTAEADAPGVVAYRYTIK